MKKHITPLNEEIRFERDEIIVSKTDLKGHLIYANDVFCRVAEMTTTDVIGQPHSIIRHPDMPRAVFKLLWDTLQSGKEIFAYVKNMSATGKYYWVIAHVTPSTGPGGQVVGYHSNRRAVTSKEIDDITLLYGSLVQIENQSSNRKTGLAESYAHFEKTLADRNMSYDEFIWKMGGHHV